MPVVKLKMLNSTLPMALYKYQDRFWIYYVKYLKAADNFHLILQAAMLTSHVLLRVSYEDGKPMEKIPRIHQLWCFP